ncbi:MAG: hypothetical protein UZ07_CHB004000201 [Chlorobi bacterium OLB7]|nr:MAG: hypothetical protein UZ07_CHB004000201 [Chlorobi bacterium OLB7]
MVSGNVAICGLTPPCDDVPAVGGLGDGSRIIIIASTKRPLPLHCSGVREFHDPVINEATESMMIANIAINGVTQPGNDVPAVAGLGDGSSFITLCSAE